MGELSILNVGAGDTRITWNKDNVSESLRTGRIIRDMLRRGYALLVEVDRDGEKKYERALDFNEKAGEYIIADFDPVEAALARKRERDAAAAAAASPYELGQHGELVEKKDGEVQSNKETPPDASAGKGRRGRRGISAAGTKAVAVGRSAGG